jgi:FkbM family methyltransferase
MPKFLLTLVSKITSILPGPIRTLFYRLPPLAGLIRKSLNWAVSERITEVTVAAGELAGVSLLLDLHQEKDYWLGTYEVELQAAVRDWVKSGWVAYDVGANIGYISLILARTVGEGGQVFAFEILPANLSRLKTNLELNDVEAEVVVVPKAVTASSNPVRFLEGPSGGTGKAEGSAGRNMEYRQSFEVPGISLDDFVYQSGHPAPQVVKMDIEGGEVLALPGMRRVLAELRPLLLLELHGSEAARQAWEQLTSLGYQIHLMKRDYPIVSSLNDIPWKAYLIANWMDSTVEKDN